MTSSTQPPRIAVLGSANIDLVSRVQSLPRPGETVRARSVSRYRGGKGANQAVAAARLGADVAFFGMIGLDAFGDDLLAGFEENGVDASAVGRHPGEGTGTATIWVDEGGENAIVVAEGANGRVDRTYVDRCLDRMAEADVLLLQLEIPIEIVAYTLRSLPPERPIVVLDPAPAAPLDGLDVSRIACATPNDDELRTLSGEGDLDRAAERLHALGLEFIVCTLGEDGAHVYRRDAPPLRFAPFPVRAVDSTAAGDAFAAALAVGLGTREPDRLGEVIRRACAAGALAAAKSGAWPSLPTAREVAELVDR